MPITEFQHEVLALLKQHRNPNSYVAGGIAINRTPGSIRHSKDIDFFHDADEAVSQNAIADLELLKKERFRINLLINQPSFYRATISRGKDSVTLEWVRDSAFRFFPVLEDELLGYRLHDIDLATNKCLALVNRNEVRDIIDLIGLQSTISIAGACWAACGKDPGFTPDLMIDFMRRNSIIRPEHLLGEVLTQEISPRELKTQWLKLLEEAELDMQGLRAADLGCLYLDKTGAVIKNPKADKVKDAERHFGSVGGSWPRLVETQ